MSLEPRFSRPSQAFVWPEMTTDFATKRHGTSLLLLGTLLKYPDRFMDFNDTETAPAIFRFSLNAETN
jgi:hypothetical protein